MTATIFKSTQLCSVDKRAAQGPTVKAILFDMDGVLINSFDAHYKCHDFILKKYCKKSMPKSIFRKTCWGFYIKENIKKLITKDENKIEQIHKEYYKKFPDFINSIKLYPETLKVLKKLKKHKIKLAIVSSTKTSVIRKIINNFKINFFDVVIGGDIVKKPKPNPEVIFLACRKLRVSVKEILLVGDTKPDALSAKRANSKVAILRNKKIKADFHLNKLSDLLKVVKCKRDICKI